MVWDQVMVFSTGIISVVCKFSLSLVQMKLHSSSYCVTYLRHFVADNDVGNHEIFRRKQIKLTTVTRMVRVVMINHITMLQSKLSFVDS